MVDEKMPGGYALLSNARLNKSTAFSAAERDAYGLHGLLPPAVCTLAAQKERALENMRRKAYDLERYIFLFAQQGRNERLFYRLVIDHIEELLPIIYTPTVGQACKEFSHIFRQPRGLYVSARDRGRVADVLANWPEKDVRMIVITDGERILGLGDLGADGMGIPIGKLALYTACAGIAPEWCLPVMLDVGTNNEELLGDSLYVGLRQRRVTGEHYLALVEEFVCAVQERWPRALIQFEDFLTPNAYGLLERYRDRVLCFNDDIQGTAAVALAGVMASTRISGARFEDLRVMFLGAGSAATGIADLIFCALREAGLGDGEARRRLWMAGRSGLLVNSSCSVRDHNRAYAHDHAPMSFVDALREIKPQVLIGATGMPGTFTQEVVRTMAEINERPAIFALSNPTSRAECTAAQAYRWSDGRAIFVSGSPFDPVVQNGRTHLTGQGNNAYVFPGIGLGALAVRSRIVSEPMFLAAAYTLAGMVSERDLEQGSIYPPLARIREISRTIAVAVAQTACAQGHAREPHGEDLAATVAGMMYDPVY